MNSCGMYDYSGEFAFHVGLPAKSGVSGAILVIVPGVMGICTYAPPLDKYGNSAKGVDFCTQISKRYSLHYFQIDLKNVLTTRKNSGDEDSQKLLHYCAMGDIGSVKRLCLNPKIDLDAGDYDGRTPLHLAASEGHLDILKQLVRHGLKDVNPTDRWGNTPLDDAKRGVF